MRVEPRIDLTEARRQAWTALESMQTELDLHDLSDAASTAEEVRSFIHRAIGLRFEMRFKWETEWWPIDAREVAETLAGYYYDYGMHSCLEQMREGKELASGLAVYRLRR
jgi:hypothetical protein